MESAKQELPTQKVESKEKPLGEFSALMAGVGAKHREAFEKEISDEKEKVLMMVRISNMTLGETEKSAEGQSLDYLDSIIRSEFGGRGGEMSGVLLNHTELKDVITIAEELAYQSSICKWNTSPKVMPEIAATKHLGILPALRKILEANFVMDDMFMANIKGLAEASEKDKQDPNSLYTATARVMKEYKELAKPENIDIVHGVAKSLSLNAPIHISTAMELLRCAGAVERYRSDTLGNENLNQDNLKMATWDLAEDPNNEKMRHKGLSDAAYTVARVAARCGDRVILEQANKDVTSLAILSLLTKDGKLNTAPLYQHLSKLKPPTLHTSDPVHNFIRATLSVNDPELLGDEYEKMFWEIWNKTFYRRASMMTGLTTPKATIEEMVKTNSGNPSMFLMFALQHPRLFDFITDETDKQFYRILVEAMDQGAQNSSIAGEYIIGKESKRALIALVAEQGGVQNLKKLSATRAVALAAEAPDEIRTFLIKGVARLQYSRDGADYIRGRNDSSRPAKTERGARRGERGETEDPFGEELEKFTLAEGDKEAIRLLRKIVREFENLTPEKTKEILASPEISSGAYLSLIELDNQIFYTQLDPSADRFEIYHQGMGRSREIPAFAKLWSKKMAEYFETQILEKLAQYPDEDAGRLSADVFAGCAKLYQDGLKLYERESVNIIPHLEEMNKFVNKKLFRKGVWFSGRDGIPLRLAVKSRLFGAEFGPKERYANFLRATALESETKRGELIALAQKERESAGLPETDDAQLLLDEGVELYLKTDAHINDLVKMAQISRLLFDNIKTEGQRMALVRYFNELEIHREMLAIDTGHNGSVIKAAIEKIYGSVTPEDIRNIALLSSNTIKGEGGTEILPSNISHSTADAVEKLPKKTDRYFVIDEETAKPVAMPSNEDVRLLSWVSEHCIMRHLAPRPPKSRERMRLSASYVVEDMLKMDGKFESEAELEQAEKKIMELYDVATEKVAPAFVTFADSLLKKASASDSKILFLARDALAAYDSALILLQKFPERYPGVSENDLEYAYLSRRVMTNNTEGDIRNYLSRLGLNPATGVVIADIGMYGTMIDPLKKLLGKSGVAVSSVDFLISRNPQINGFLDDEAKPLKSLEDIPGNPVVHFLEDTFSGAKRSPQKIVYDDDLGDWAPFSSDGPYPPVEMLKRSIALLAVKNCALSITKKSLDASLNREELDQLFLEKGEYLRDELGVPHER